MQGLHLHVFGGFSDGFIESSSRTKPGVFKQLVDRGATTAHVLKSGSVGLVVRNELKFRFGVQFLNDGFRQAFNGDLGFGSDIEHLPKS